MKARVSVRAPMMTTFLLPYRSINGGRNKPTMTKTYMLGINNQQNYLRE